ncbi:GyrI-like domain-containing protein [Paenibacillus sp. sgz5001063]|uniref:GyrI-like domain-containing protein n=1 Tax=Paenibacillus sp. sgz5001063 TaxID=3242474 RepID=UPI0036D4030E
MKYEWKKQEKAFYLPPSEPGLIKVPAYPYFMVTGNGNPNSDEFAEAVGVLYSLSYAVKMLPKKGPAPEGYHEYSIFPLEGVWDLSEQGRLKAELDKDELVYNIMIRQPDFVTPVLAAEMMEKVKRAKPQPLLDRAVFASCEDGLCVQMLHLGPYDNEPASFRRMEEYCRLNGLRRISKTHREIYITDNRRTKPENLKTVLRFLVSREE